MKELERFQKLFRDHYDGDPWIEINIRGTLEGLSAKGASQKVGSLNTIWQIVNHAINWRETLLKRIQGENAPAPENNFIETITDVSEEAWSQTLKRLQSSQDHLLSYLSAEKEINLDEKPREGPYSRYELIEGILQHDVYHLGQIVLIKKMIGEQNLK
jgi:uncharacterized damage-inducible protein DinB